MPPDSVILTNRYWNAYNFVVSGLTGRAVYLEVPGITNPRLGEYLGRFYWRRLLRTLAGVFWLSSCLRGCVRVREAGGDRRFSIN